MRVWLVAFFVAILPFPALSQAIRPEVGHAMEAIRPQGLRSHMRFLSDSLLEGRETGSRGYDLAALYVGAQLEALGLEPAVESGWSQKIALRRAINDGNSRVTLNQNGEEIPFKYDEQYAVYGDLAHTASTVSAAVVFVGYGIRAPELGYNDYAGVDVRGKIVARLIGAPPQFSPDQLAHYAEPIAKQRLAEALGAVGMLVIPVPDGDGGFSSDMGLFNPRTRGLRAWLNPDGEPSDSFPKMAPLVLLTPSGSKALFSNSSRSLDEIYKTADLGRVQTFQLPLKATIHGSSRHENLRSANVVAKITGSDPKLKDEYVVFSAHLDHLGHCPPVNGDDICHGASDNASGVASLLEIARAYKNLSIPPRRSILFAFFTGEEGRWEGSDYFLHFPPVPLDAMVANINLDIAPGFLDAANFVKAIGADHSTLSETIKRAAEKCGYIVMPNPIPASLPLIASDQYLFFLHGIPAVYILDSAGGDPVRRQAMLDWSDRVYHTPLDSMDQPFNFQLAARTSGLSFLIGYDIAQADDRPRWVSGDFFGTQFGRSSERK
jgi:Peptidase family M28